MINTPAFEALLSRERGFSQYTSNSNTVVSSSGSSELRRQAWIQSLCLPLTILFEQVSDPRLLSKGSPLLPQRVVRTFKKKCHWHFALN